MLRAFLWQNYPICCRDSRCTASFDAYKKAVRISIGVGNEGEYDEEELLRFSNQSEVGLLKAQNAAALVQHIKWASTAAAVGASMGKSKLHGEEGEIILLDTPPQPMLSDQGDVF